MCDYSLEMLLSHPATVGEKLISTRFSGTMTRGFSTEGGNPQEAVCMIPGTEVAFDEPVQADFSCWGAPDRKTYTNVAVFTEIDKEISSRHHDALEFPDGSRVLVHHLVEGQKCSVLQLPSEKSTISHTDLPTDEEAKETAIQKVIQRVAELIS